MKKIDAKTARIIQNLLAIVCEGIEELVPDHQVIEMHATIRGVFEGSQLLLDNGFQPPKDAVALITRIRAIAGRGPAGRA